VSTIKKKLIVALDVETLNEAEKFVSLLAEEVEYFKIGSQLFTAYGPEAVKMVGSKGKKVFLDLKFHDIPNTVAQAVISGTTMSCAPSSASVPKNPVFMMTVHTAGGSEMLKIAAAAAAHKAQELQITKPYIVGVTVLTSDADTGKAQAEVLARAQRAYDAGLDGIVCAVSEAREVRKQFGEKFLIITPGIRAKGADKGDQQRTATAAEALDAGSDYIVVGRPILKASNPLQAVRELL
jgi:orotidine-5'-phosphate decarboxylase